MSIGVSTLAAGSPAEAPSLSEISGLMKKRLAWYGLPHLALQRVDIGDGGHIVAALADTEASVTYEEVFDRSTGKRRARIARFWRR